MKKILVTMLVCLLFAGVQAQKTAKISATAVGYTGKVVDFEFIDNPANNQQFPFKDNQLMEFEVELKEPSLMKVNAWLWMIVCPGDEIEMAIQFQGKNYKHVEFQGTPSAVALNSAIRDGRMVRINDHYKTNPLAAVVTQVPAKTYYEACLRNWKKEQEILEGVRGKVDEFAFNYIYAELEGMYMDNLVKYPFIVSDVNKKPLQECTPEGYWSILDNYQIKSDKASLKSYAYIGWLIDYLEYQERREAYKAGKEDSPAGNMEELYNKLAKAYEGDTRDAVLYLFLYNAISGQKDFDVIKKLSKDYFKKYNKDKRFKKELTEMQK
mgnify:FL=1|jgi:hypothetical protein